jgi:acyl carrier protein phosphodiesterase
MNYLAHLFLAGESAESMIGNLAGDFVKGPIHGDDAISAGIRKHRKIDAFTDAHPSAAAFRRVLIPDHGHYARVIADVFFDHFLANDFGRYSDETLEAFVARVHAALDPHAHELPGRLRVVYPYMRDQQWLLSYRSVSGIHLALTNLSRRLSRQPHLEAATNCLIDPRRRELERRFDDFFPDLIEFSTTV